MVSDNKHWSARFAEPIDELMMRFNASIPFDHRLARYDVQVSIAHVRMLGTQQIIARQVCDKLIGGLEQLAQKIAADDFSWQLSDEDIHTSIERKLIELVGEDAKRMHTARSRNDQISTDIRLWLRDMIDLQCKLLARMQLALVTQAERHVDSIMPGFTHLQVAQPTTLAHHLHAHCCVLTRDTERLNDCRGRVNQLPLGAAALAGTGFAINPQQVADELGFERLCANTMDAVAARDFAVEYVAVAALVMVNLSRLCEEIVIWSSQPFAFAQVADSYCTGSSIMPQKRNPDAAELVRGKSGRVAGHVVALLLMTKGQPLAYNKDNQEDKEALFDAADTLSSCLQVMEGMVATMKFDVAAMRQMADQGYACATELADLLVRHDVAFRDAHEMVAKAVKEAELRVVSLNELCEDYLPELTGLTASELRRALDVEQAIAARNMPGAPAPEAMQKLLGKKREELENTLRDK